MWFVVSKLKQDLLILPHCFHVAEMFSPFEMILLEIGKALTHLRTCVCPSLVNNLKENKRLIDTDQCVGFLFHQTINEAHNDADHVEGEQIRLIMRLTMLKDTRIDS